MHIHTSIVNYNLLYLTVSRQFTSTGTLRCKMLLLKHYEIINIDQVSARIFKYIFCYILFSSSMHHLVIHIILLLIIDHWSVIKSYPLHWCIGSELYIFTGHSDQVSLLRLNDHWSCSRFTKSQDQNLVSDSTRRKFFSCCRRFPRPQQRIKSCIMISHTTSKNNKCVTKNIYHSCQFDWKQTLI